MACAAPAAISHAGRVVRVLAAETLLALLACLPLLLAPDLAAAETSGALQLATGLSKLSTQTPSTEVAVTNSGTAPVDNVVVALDAPDWSNAGLTAPGLATAGSVDLGTLPAGASRLITLNADIPFGGRGGTITLRATGRSGVPKTALATVALPEASPVISLDLAGAADIGDRSPGLVTAVLHNNTAERIVVDISARGDGLAVQPAAAHATWPLDIAIEPGQTATTDLTVKTSGAVRPRQVALVVTANAKLNGQASSVVATHDLSLSITAGGLVPAVVGIGSALVLPGLGALLAFLAIREDDRARLKVARRNVAATVWDNKTLLLAALAVSLAAIAGLNWVTGIDLIATPWTWWLILITAWATVVGAAVSVLVVRRHRAHIAVINDDSGPNEVLVAAAGGSPEIRRKVYLDQDGRKGLYVHRDRDMVVLSPPIAFSKPGSITNDTTLAQIVRAIHDNRGFDGEFRREDGWVAHPTPVPETTPPTGTWEALARYEVPQG